MKLQSGTVAAFSSPALTRQCQRLYGRRSYQSTFFGKPVAHEFEASHVAPVLAFFPGTTYVVVTDGGKAASAPTWWPEVVAAGRPVVVERFRPTRIKRRRPRVRRRRPPP